MWFYKPEWEKGCDVKGGTFQDSTCSLPFFVLLQSFRTWTALAFSGALVRLRASRFLT
jgi:hypothetical protein